MQTLAGPDERAAYIWVLGEHGQRVQSAPYLLEALVEGFADEAAKVRLALLAAVPRLFFRRAPECRGALGALLAAGAADADVEVRDRALFALRLLRHDVHAAREVLGAPLPLISRPGEEQAAEVEVRPAGFRGGVVDQGGVLPWQGCARAHCCRRPGVCGHGASTRLSAWPRSSLLPIPGTLLAPQDRIFDEMNTLSVLYRAPAYTFIDPTITSVGGWRGVVRCGIGGIGSP